MVVASPSRLERLRASGWWPDRAAAGATVASGLKGRANALGLIRLVLASAVIVSHAFPLSGHHEDPVLRWSMGQANLGGFAVVGFFAISGYLITKSGMRSDILRYMWARFLRIFPAFWAVLLISVFAIGPVIWFHLGRPFSSYFTTAPGGAIAYLRDNWTLTIHQWGIADIFSATPYGHEVGGGSVLNGSLWTLADEWACYLMIGCAVLFAVGSGLRLIIPVLTAVLFGMQIAKLSGASFGKVVPWLADANLVYLGLVFMLGACIAVYADRIPLDDRLGLFALAVSVFTAFRGGFLSLGLPAFAYALLWLAARLPARFKVVGARNDYSYGLYLWGFLVEQMLAYVGVWRWGYAPYVVLSLALSAVAAWLSWHLIEKQALALKDWGPGRGIAHWWVRLRSPRRSAAGSSMPVDSRVPVVPKASLSPVTSNAEEAAK